MPFPTAVDAIVDGPPLTAATVIHASQVQGVQRITVGPTMYNVKSDQYGAKGDGATDDTTAIQTALNVARTGGGGIVFFPFGTYMLSVAARVGSGTWNTALMFGGSTVLQGAGRDATVLKLLASQPGMVNFATGSVGVITPWAVSQEQIVFSDFTVDGNAANQTDQHIGIFCTRQRGVKFHRVRIMNCRGTNNAGGTTENHLFHAHQGGDYSYVDCEAIQTAGTCANGFTANGMTSVVYTGCRAIGIGTSPTFGYGFNVGTAGAGSREVVYQGCHGYLCGAYGFHVDSANTQHISYMGCVAGGISSDVASASQYPFTQSQSLGNGIAGFDLEVAANEIHYVGCQSLNNTSEGYRCFNGSSNRVDYIACTAANNGTDGILFGGTPIIRIIGGNWSNNAGGIHSSGATAMNTAAIKGSPILVGNSVAAVNANGTTFAPPPASVTAPAIPASAAAFFNPFGFDAMVQVTGGTVSAISIGAGATGLTSGWFRLPAGQTITLTYTVAPTWTWWLE